MPVSNMLNKQLLEVIASNGYGKLNFDKMIQELIDKGADVNAKDKVSMVCVILLPCYYCYVIIVWVHCS